MRQSRAVGSVRELACCFCCCAAVVDVSFISPPFLGCFQQLHLRSLSFFFFTPWAVFSSCIRPLLSLNFHSPFFVVVETAVFTRLSFRYAFYNEDVREDFVSNYVFKGIANNCLYEGRYLCGTAIARPCIAKRQTEIAWAEDAKFVSHGSTGKGNDQVRHLLQPMLVLPGPTTLPEQATLPL